MITDLTINFFFNLFESKIHFEVESKKRFVIDLFAGCGGLATGLELAGFNPALVCEIDQDARQSYLMNRFSWLGDKPFKDLEEFHYADAAKQEPVAIRFSAGWVRIRGADAAQSEQLRRLPPPSLAPKASIPLTSPFQSCVR